jgi:hypothetical protein
VLSQNARIAVTGIAMVEIEVEDGPRVEISAGQIREQLDLLVRDHAFRSSRRSVAFLRYVVEQAIKGSADQIKERTIGVEVFEREPSYDTNLDHVVRTAATELRKRLAIYYGEERHRSELRIGLTPGSYRPRFTLPANVQSSVGEREMASGSAVIAPQTDGANGEIHSESLEKGPPGRNVAGRRQSRYSLAIVLSGVLLVAGFSMSRSHASRVFSFFYS